MIVFPVAAFSVVMPAGILRTLLQAVAVTVPRNVIKTRLMHSSTCQVEALLAKHKQDTQGNMVLTEEEQRLLREGVYENLFTFMAVGCITVLMMFSCCFVINAHKSPLVQTLVDK